MKKLVFSIILLSILPLTIFGQKPSSGTGQILGQEGGVITTAAPFLLISPDARAGGMGDMGAASEPDAYSQHWNPAKYAFLEEDLTVSLTYSPWLMALVSDMSLSYLTLGKKIDKRSSLAFSLLYFSLGEVLFKEHAQDLGTAYIPHEFAVDGSYSRMLTDRFSIAVAARYIYSNLTLGQHVGGASTRAGQSVAADIAGFYTEKYDIGGKKTTISAGFNISNIGSKISYSDENVKKDFIPTNMRLGVGYKVEMDDYNSFTILADINKLLVPTPPIYDTADGGGITISAGKDPNVSPISGVFQSFTDAPGGFKEEMKEFTWSIGGEYWYNNIVGIRGGYFHESESKGNRKFFTLGAGIKYSSFILDFSYLLPAAKLNSHPLKNTLRFSITFNFNKPTANANKSL